MRITGHIQRFITLPRFGTTPWDEFERQRDREEAADDMLSDPFFPIELDLATSPTATDDDKTRHLRRRPQRQRPVTLFTPQLEPLDKRLL